jgi:fumarate hydratase subunit beta
VKEAKVLAFEDLGAEAIHSLVVKEIPVTVIIDSTGNNLYKSGRAAYLTQQDGI